MSCDHHCGCNCTPEYEDSHNSRYYSTSSYTPSIASSRRENPPSSRCESYWTSSDMSNLTTSRGGRGDPALSDISAYSTGTMFTSAINSHQQQQPTVPSQEQCISLEKVRIRLQLLEDSNIVMSRRNRHLITENNSLKEQLRDVTQRNKNLLEKITSLEKNLQNFQSSIDKKLCAKDVEIFTDSILYSDQTCQVQAVCKSCQGKLMEGMEEQIVVITKKELETLEKDMQHLKSAITAREEIWENSIERDENYRRQMAYLTSEAITARHLSQTRQEELETLARTLREQQVELLGMKKERGVLEKLIHKLMKHERENNENKSAQFTEKEERLIADIERRIENGKVKQKSKGGRGFYSESKRSQSQQSNPCQAKNQG